LIRLRQTIKARNVGAQTGRDPVPLAADVQSVAAEVRSNEMRAEGKPTARTFEPLVQIEDERPNPCASR
jgi:hypothetical protein